MGQRRDVKRDKAPVLVSNNSRTGGKHNLMLTVSRFLTPSSVILAAEEAKHSEPELGLPYTT